jgi:hypothetical protein
LHMSNIINPKMIWLISTTCFTYAHIQVTPGEEACAS